MNSNGVRKYGMPEEQMLLHDRVKANVINTTANGKTGEKQSFLTPEPVRLTPAWEETNLPNDELNFKGVTMEQAHLETNPPKDRLKIVYLIVLLHGIGTLMPWNMFITAKNYFVEYKLSQNYTNVETDYDKNFLAYLGIAAQGPNLIFNWLNIFIQIGGKLTTRIVWSIAVEMVAFTITVIMAMLDSSTWPGLFFWITMVIIVVLNMANGIYQNTVFGMAAKLPPKYTGGIIFGSNLSGVISSVASILSLAIASNPRTAAIYYFIAALFILVLCFDSYFVLPLNRFYKYNELMHQKELQRKQKENPETGKKIPYWKIYKKCFGMCFNIFLIFFVTLAVFPAIDSDVKVTDENFIIPNKYYVDVMCFLTFNVFALVGSSLPALGSWPGPRWIWVPAVLRFAFIPLFLLCNYQPKGIERILPVLFNDWAYLGFSIALGITQGYFSSVSLMYCPGTVSPEHAQIASMFGAAHIITGICAGVGASIAAPWAVGNISFSKFQKWPSLF